MNTQLHGMLIDGLQTGLLVQVSRITNVTVSTTSALSGTLNIAGNGPSFTTSAGLNGVEQAGADLFGPVYFTLSDAADLGKARVTWKPV